MRLSSTLHRPHLLLREGRGAEREGGRALGNRRTVDGEPRTAHRGHSSMKSRTRNRRWGGNSEDYPTGPVGYL